MSFSNTFTKDLNQTPFEDAYKHQTYSEHKPLKDFKLPKYSPICIFCSCKDTIPLVNDGGSFRNCTNCKRQFKAVILQEPLKSAKG